MYQLITSISQGIIKKANIWSELKKTSKKHGWNFTEFLEFQKPFKIIFFSEKKAFSESFVNTYHFFPLGVQKSLVQFLK